MIAMKIVLIRPYYDSFIFSPSLSLGYLASVIKENGCEAKIVDALRDNLDNEMVLEFLKKEQPDLVGITSISAFYHESVNLAKLIKNNGFKTFLGGVHPTFLPYSTLNDSNADFVVCGEGEIAVKELIKQNLNPEGIQGIYTISDLSSDEEKFLFAKQVEDLDEIPMPDWEQLRPDLLPKAPHGAFAKGFPIGTIMTSRGCPYNCIFCASPAFYGRKVRFRSVDKILDEAQYLKDRFNIKEIQIVDDNLALRKEFLLEFCQKYIDRKIGLPWSCPNGLRADKLDDEICKSLKKAGCYYVAVGVESGDEKMLMSINKSETLEEIERGINCLKRAKIVVQGNFIIGHHCETRESLKNTLNFIDKLALDRLNLEILELLPGSELWKNLSGKFTPNFTTSSSKVPTIKNPEFSKEELSTILEKASKKFYSKPVRLLKLLSLIKISQLSYILKRLSAYKLISFFKKNT